MTTEVLQSAITVSGYDAYNDLHTGMERSDPEKLFLDSLSLVERLGRHFCAGSRMSAEDVEDFIAHVRLHLLDNDYAVLRAFQGRCRLSTFLALTIRNLLSDYRARMWGRFRPSTTATRMGPVALRMEVLLRRDGHSIPEAVAVLAAEGHRMSLAEAQQLADALPHTIPRPRSVDLDEIDSASLPVTDETIERDAMSTERQATVSRIASTMRTAMNDMSEEDRTILRLHFDAGFSIADIARSLGLVVRPLYRRVPRLCAELRERLLAAGVDRGDVADVLGKADTEMDFGLRDAVTIEPRPSIEKEEGVRR